MFNTKEINIDALDAVLTAVLGPQGSAAIAQAVEFAEGIMRRGYEQGYEAGYDDGHTDEHSAFEEGYEYGKEAYDYDTFDDGWNAGYEAGREDEKLQALKAAEYVPNFTLVGGPYDPTTFEATSFTLNVPDEALDDDFNRLNWTIFGSTNKTGQNYDCGLGRHFRDWLIDQGYDRNGGVDLIVRDFMDSYWSRDFRDYDDTDYYKGAELLTAEDFREGRNS